MVQIFTRLKDIRFSSLMEVYAEGNLENARELYPDLDSNAALLQVEQDFYTYLEDCFFRTEGTCYAVWSEKGRYISAFRLEPYRDGLLLEALETAPEYRRRGFAKRLIQEALKDVEVPVYSHVNKHNTASLQTHRCCGFERVSEQAIYVDGSVNDRCCTLCRK